MPSLLRISAHLALLLAATATTLTAQERLSEGATRVRVNQIETAEEWALKGLMLMSLGQRYHPIASQPALQAAFEGKDDRLKAYALSLLGTTDPAQLPAMATPELIEELVMKQLKQRNKTYHEELLKVLALMVPDAEAEDARDWKGWWRKQKREWQAPVWVEPEREESEGEQQQTSAAVARALDLKAAGLDVTLAIDSTGSMQPAIDACHEALSDIVDVLSGIAPDFRVGLVHYKDFGDFSDGAQVLERLTKNTRAVKTRLARLTASGGGDVPERLEAGLKFACSHHMGWGLERNKVIILMGDAPPHESAFEELLEMARTARKDPGKAIAGFRPVSGKLAQDVRGFLISTILVKHQTGRGRGGAGGGGGAGGPQQAADDMMNQLSEAGGGTHSRIQLGGNRSDVAANVVKNILQLSFGPEYQDAVGQFIDTFYKWRNAGMWK